MKPAGRAELENAGKRKQPWHPECGSSKTARLERPRTPRTPERPDAAEPGTTPIQQPRWCRSCSKPIAATCHAAGHTLRTEAEAHSMAVREVRKSHAALQAAKAELRAVQRWRQGVVLTARVRLDSTNRCTLSSGRVRVALSLPDVSPGEKAALRDALEGMPLCCDEDGAAAEYVVKLPGALLDRLPVRAKGSVLPEGTILVGPGDGSFAVHFDTVARTEDLGTRVLGTVVKNLDALIPDLCDEECEDKVTCGWCVEGRSSDVTLREVTVDSMM